MVTIEYHGMVYYLDAHMSSLELVDKPQRYVAPTGTWLWEERSTIWVLESALISSITLHRCSLLVNESYSYSTFARKANAIILRNGTARRCKGTFPESENTKRLERYIQQAKLKVK